MGAQQRLLALAEMLRVAIDVTGVDGEQDLVLREGVAVAIAKLVARRPLPDAAGPGRDATVGAAGPLRAQGREPIAAEERLLALRLGPAPLRDEYGREPEGGGGQQLASQGLVLVSSSR
jgi:hypothetical protein